MMTCVLASASPRRLELLRQIGIDPIVHAVDIDETPMVGESAEDYVKRMGIEKTMSARNSFADDVVIVGSDTTIDFQGEIIGKPDHPNDAEAVLNRLSAQSHRVLTSVAVSRANQRKIEVVSTKVFFRRIEPEEIHHYIETGEPEDKAGAYAIQGLGSLFVEKIHGSYSAVMGLPLFETAAMLKAFGINPLTCNMRS